MLIFASEMNRIMEQKNLNRIKVMLAERNQTNGDWTNGKNSTTVSKGVEYLSTSSWNDKDCKEFKYIDLIHKQE